MPKAAAASPLDITESLALDRLVLGAHVSLLQLPSPPPLNHDDWLLLLVVPEEEE